MDDINVDPETYTNCCGIPHWINSVFICVVSTIAAFIACLLAIGLPDILEIIYKVGGTETKILICGTAIAGILLTSDGFLAIGIIMDWALFLLVWIILNILVWNLHLILYLHSLVFYYLEPYDCREPWGSYRLVALFILQVIWLLFIVMVGQHWYAVCEDLYRLEHSVRAPVTSRLMAVNYTASTRYRLRAPFD